jgi:CRISPR-associated endonuclease/helicase Cas3
MSKVWNAHSKNAKGVAHRLADHLKESAEVAASFCKNKTIKTLVYITALLHDAGKYTGNFQDYLDEKIPKAEPHAHWGAKIINTLYGESKTHILINETKHFMGEMPAMAILGHHSGLKDRSGLTDKLYADDKDKTFLNILTALLDDLNLEIETMLSHCLELEGLTPLEWDIYIRYIFSCLTDADWLDTEKHFDEDKSAARVSYKLEYDRLIKEAEKYIRSKNSENPSPINRIRMTVLEYALTKAFEPVGFYSLNLPTGYGKTLISVLWALKHAKHHNLDRIIIVLPFINIIDQSASILKEIFGEEIVLEHHSNIISDSKDDEGESKYDVKKLAVENWDYPIIITTTVQFFESLFSSKTSKCRKLHNIANSVVIFDEVQTLPKELTEPTIEMLKDWLKHFNTTFLFSTATMPTFQKRNKFNGIENITSLVEKPEELFLSSKRVKYHILNDFDEIKLSELAEITDKSAGSVLAVFNTRKLARSFYKHIEKESWETAYFLTNDMYPKHRLDVINKIKKDLKDGKRIILSSTQLIEAGVDLDFENVFRQLAPLDAIIQSAGRCNREGMLECGDVFIFLPENAMFPSKEYETLSKHTKDFLRDDLQEIYSTSLFKRYYSEAVDFFINIKLITKFRERLNFKSVNDNYKLINNITYPVFIKSANEKLYDRIKYKPFLSREDFRDLQLYSVQLFDSMINKNAHDIEPLENGVRVWHGKYSEELGIEAGDEHLSTLFFR